MIAGAELAWGWFVIAAPDSLLAGDGRDQMSSPWGGAVEAASECLIDITEELASFVSSTPPQFPNSFFSVHRPSHEEEPTNPVPYLLR